MDKKYHRRSIRLKGYDYASAGAYFITICTSNKEILFGKIADGKIILKEYGEIVKNEWIKTGQMRANIDIDIFSVMPNHLHGIIIIKSDVGAHCNVPLRNKTIQTEKFGHSTKNSIPTIVKLFKSTTTKQINELRRMPDAPVWQRNYYEHVIRGETDLNRIREYIINNPARWEQDDYYVK